MRGDDGRGAYSDNNNSDTESIGSERAAFSGPLMGGKQISKRASRKSARFVLPGESKPVMAGTTSNKYTSGGDGDEAYVELTLDIGDDSVVVHSVQSAVGNQLEDPELTLLARKTLERRSSFGSNIFRNTSNKFRQVSQELRRLASHSRRPGAPGRFDRTKSAAAHALVGLKFISTAKAGGAAGWNAVEKRFDELTLPTNGLLPSSLFGECIGKLPYPLFTHNLNMFCSCSISHGSKNS